MKQAKKFAFEPAVGTSCDLRTVDDVEQRRYTMASLAAQGGDAVVEKRFGDEAIA